VKKILGLSLLALLTIGSVAFAQTPNGAGNTVPNVPLVQTVGPTDLFQDVVNGSPSVGNQYATAGQIAGVPSFVLQVPLTGFSLTFGNSQTYMILNPAGTLATGTITMAPAPANGQRACTTDTQIQTAIVFAANSGQTIVGNPTAEATAPWTVCFTYVAASSAWIRS
jgi:hypothetical protein